MSGISIKGTRDGIALIVPPAMAVEDASSQLQERIETAPGLFEGGRVLMDFCGRDDFTQLKDVLGAQLLKAGVGEFSLTSDILPGKTKPSAQDISYLNANHYSSSATKLIKGTVRSGQLLSHNGDIVIMGDVNPGAEVIAKGHIIIFGSLRGVAHAGAEGEKSAFVAALSLEPTQVRIAGLVARPPDNEKNKKRGPEVVFIQDNELVIEPYTASLKCLQ